MSSNVLLSLAVNSKSERKVNSVPSYSANLWSSGWFKKGKRVLHISLPGSRGRLSHSGVQRYSTCRGPRGGGGWGVGWWGEDEAQFCKLASHERKLVHIGIIWSRQNECCFFFSNFFWGYIAPVSTMDATPIVWVWAFWCWGVNITSRRSWFDYLSRLHCLQAWQLVADKDW
jgi:hypothetical protein